MLLRISPRGWRVIILHSGWGWSAYLYKYKYFSCASSNNVFINCISTGNCFISGRRGWKQLNAHFNQKTYVRDVPAWRCSIENVVRICRVHTVTPTSKIELQKCATVCHVDSRYFIPSSNASNHPRKRNFHQKKK